MSSDEKDDVLWLATKELLVFPKFFLFVLPLIVFLIMPFIPNDYGGFFQNNINSPMPNKHKFIADFTAIHFMIMFVLCFVKKITSGFSEHLIAILTKKIQKQFSD